MSSGVFVLRNSTDTAVNRRRSRTVRTNSYFVSDRTLSVLRFVFALLTAAMIVWQLILQGPSYFYYLTHWNWILNFFYFSVGFIHKTPTHSSLLKTLFASSQSISWIVSIVFWALLFDSNQAPIEIFSQIISHSLNLAFPLIDLVLCRIILRLPHILCPIIFSLLYMIGVLIVHLQFGTAWPYSFLVTVNQQEDGLNVGYTIAFIVGFWIVTGLFFGLSMLLIWIRERFGRITSKRKPELFTVVEQNIQMTEVVKMHPDQ